MKELSCICAYIYIYNLCYTYAISPTQWYLYINIYHEDVDMNNVQNNTVYVGMHNVCENMIVALQLIATVTATR